MSQLIREIEKVLQQLKRSISSDDLNELKITPAAELYLYTFSLGRHIQQHYLKEGSSLLKAFRLSGYRDTEEMCSIIILMLHQDLSQS